MDHSIEYRETGPWRCPRPTELSVLIEDLERVLAPLKTLGVCTPSESPFHSPSVRENFEKNGANDVPMRRGAKNLKILTELNTLYRLAQCWQ